MVSLLLWTALAVANQPRPPSRDDAPRFLAADGGSLVLERTEVHAEVSAGLAVVDVRQEFHNPYDHPIDASYLFPLPPDAAVRAMTLSCGARTLEGQILDRDEARALYEKAASEGKKAALLQQERPNLFQQRVASLCPGEDVVVELQYVDPLVLEDGHYELVFPTTVGPRYEPGGVPEPPFTTLPAHMVSVDVVIDEGMPVRSIWSDSHAVEIDDEDDGVARVRTMAEDDLPNRDFHLGWSLAGEQAQVSAIALPPVGGEDGYLALNIEPGLVTEASESRPRELIFVLDSSCSMQGEPWAAEVETIRTALRQMRPGDTFDVLRFSSRPVVLFDAPVPNTPENVAYAETWLQTAFDGQGTEMEAGLVRALTLPGDPERLRLILLLSDGYIGAEEQILASVRQKLGAARVFSLGIGSSVNRYLLDSLAELGRGDVAYQLAGTPISETVARFYQRIDHAAWTDLSLDWGGLDVYEVYPARLPDLFAGQPLRVVARYRGSPGQHTIRVSGQTARGPVSLGARVDLAGAQTHEAVSTLWARQKIASLSRTMFYSDRLRGEQEIARVAKQHHLVSPFTSLVAVERGRSACGPATGGVDVPSMVPEGVSAPAVGVLGRAGYGSGGGSFGAKAEGSIVAVGGDPIVLASMDRSLIDAVIKRNLNQVRYCYQRELQKNPTLSGKIVVRFTIAADGTVSKSEIKSSTLGNTTVEDCVVQRFLRFEFPEPKGGGVVVVSYPIAFSPN